MLKEDLQLVDDDAVVYCYLWLGLGKSTMYVQELKSLLLTNLVASLVRYPDTTIE